MTSNPTSRAYNTAAVLDLVLSQAPLTRNQVIEATGLSKATVSRAVEQLRADGFVVDGALDEVAGRGRRSTYLDVPGTAGHVAGISLGVLNTGVLISDLRGREIQHVIVPTPDHDRTESAAEWLVDMITETSSEAAGPLRQVVLAVPGRVPSGADVIGPAEAVQTCAGPHLQRTLADRLQVSVRLDSDANASLLGMLSEDATVGRAVLFSLSSVLSFAYCDGHEIARGRTAAFGNIGVLCSGVTGQTLGGLLSASGLLRFARGQGIDLERIEDLWLHPEAHPERAKVLEAFTTAMVAAVNAVTVTLDPESVLLVGRLRPLAEEVLPQVRRRLEADLSAGPELRAPAQTLGLSVARGAVLAALAMVRDRLREALLDVRRRGHGEPSGPAF